MSVGGIASRDGRKLCNVSNQQVDMFCDCSKNNISTGTLVGALIKSGKVWAETSRESRQAVDMRMQD